MQKNDIWQTCCDSLLLAETEKILILYSFINY